MNRISNKPLVALCTATLWAVALPAWAQDKPATAPAATKDAATTKPATPAATDAAKPADTAAANNKDAADQPQRETVATDEENMKWAQVRGIETAQKRPVQKVGRFGATLYGGLIPNNIFERYYPVGLRLNYYILENLGIEIAGSYTFGVETGLSENLQDKQGVSAVGVLLGDRQVAHTNFGIVWSPIFGKTSFLNRELNYFDMYLFAGVGGLVKATQSDFGVDPDYGFGVEGALGGGFKFFFNDNFIIRLDLRQFIFQKVTGGGVATPTELSLGLMYML